MSGVQVQEDYCIIKSDFLCKTNHLYCSLYPLQPLCRFISPFKWKCFELTLMFTFKLKVATNEGKKIFSNLLVCIGFVIWDFLFFSLHCALVKMLAIFSFSSFSAILVNENSLQNWRILETLFLVQQLKLWKSRGALKCSVLTLDWTNWLPKKKKALRLLFLLYCACV